MCYFIDCFFESIQLRGCWVDLFSSAASVVYPQIRLFDLRGMFVVFPLFYADPTWGWFEWNGFCWFIDPWNSLKWRNQITCTMALWISVNHQATQTQTGEQFGSVKGNVYSPPGQITMKKPLGNCLLHAHLAIFRLTIFFYPKYK